jgi:hypothetical protein
MAENRWTGTVILDNAVLGTLKRSVQRLQPSLLATTETDSGWDLPSNSIVRDVFAYVNTAEATGGTTTIDIGILSTESGGDVDGFADGISVAATGFVRPGVTTSDGSSIKHISSTTRGVLLAEFEAGSDGGAGQRSGVYVETPHLADSITGKSVSVTPGSADFAELDADIYVVYDEIVTL